MRLTCPYCGSRGNDEFVYLGTADRVRPSHHDAPSEQWTEYVYMRTNPAGANRELWHHSFGCRSWLIVTRDTRTHEVLETEPARDASHASSQVALP
jgi:methylglutamate dehydrogenase subunit B